MKNIYEYLEELDAAEFKKARLVLVTSHDESELNVIIETLKEETIETILKSKGMIDGIVFIMENLERIEDFEDTEIQEIFTWYYDYETSLIKYIENEYKIFEDAGQYAEEWIESVTGRDGIEGLLEKELGGYMARLITWKIDMQEIGESMIRGSEGVHELSDGRILEIFL